MSVIAAAPFSREWGKGAAAMCVWREDYQMSSGVSGLS